MLDIIFPSAWQNTIYPQEAKSMKQKSGEDI